MKDYTILLIEDDLSLANVLKDFFTDNDLIVYHTADGNKTFPLYKECNPNLIILDVILPNKSGFEIIKEIKKENLTLPIILMTGTELDVDSEVKGYELGAINYVKKPVVPQVLLAQIKNLLSIPVNLRTYKIKGREILIHNQTLKIDKDETIKMRDKDIHVLSVLLDNESLVVTREDILLLVWNNTDQRLNNALDSAVLRLRKILKDYKDIVIETVYGVGYCVNITTKKA